MHFGVGDAVEGADVQLALDHFQVNGDKYVLIKVFIKHFKNDAMTNFLLTPGILS